MNWRHRVEKAITGKFSLREDGSAYVGFNEDVVKIINKCRIKYSSKFFKHSSGNTFNSNKTYDVNGTIYRVNCHLYPDQCGYTAQEKSRKKTFKYVEKMHIFNSYDEVPEELKNRISLRMSDDDMTRVVVWEYVRGGYGGGK